MAVPHTEDVAQSVVDTLLQIARRDELVWYIPIDLWSWLTKRSSLAPICWGRRSGTQHSTVRLIRALKDIEALKSYLLLVWSEWDISCDFSETCTSIREDFGGIGLGHHRADLIQRLDHVLGQLDCGLDYLNRQNHYLNEGDIREMGDRRGRLGEVLLEANIEGIARTCYPKVMLLSILTQVDIHRISRNIYVRTSPPMSIVSRLEPTTSFSFHPLASSVHGFRYTRPFVPRLTAPSLLSY